MVTDEMMMALEGFHHSTARQIAVVTAKKGDGGEWYWGLVGTALGVTGMCTIRNYMRRR